MKHLLALAVLLLSFNANAALVILDHSFDDAVIDDLYTKFFGDTGFYISNASGYNRFTGEYEPGVGVGFTFSVTENNEWYKIYASPNSIVSYPTSLGSKAFSPRVGQTYRASMRISYNKPGQTGFLSIQRYYPVQHVPVPASAFLFAPALLGFMALRRPCRRRNV